CAVTTLCTGLLFGGMPALFGARAGAEWLRSGRSVAGGAARARGMLIAAELALAVVLAVGAGIMGRSVAALHAVDAGFRADHALTMRVQPTGRSAEERRAYWQEVLAAVRATPGVHAAGTVLHLPLAGRTWSESVEIEGVPDPGPAGRPRSAWQAVSTGYFDAAGIPILGGRDVHDADGAGGAPVVVVNDVFARTVLGEAQPIGRRIRTGNATGGEWATIVGVVGSVRHYALDREPPAEIYVPFGQRAVVATGLFVRTTSNPAALAGELRRRIREVDPDVPISHVQTMEQLVDTSLGRPRLLLSLLGSFALLGVTLGAVGIAGVVARVVRQRRREIGIRMALGASATSVAGLVAKESLAWAALGVLAGVAGTLAFARLLDSFVFGVSSTDPATFVAVPFGLFLVAALAGFLPARGAARVDPATVLGE
ncbi:MAG TPA: FtsX-like permease family protein, partial [Albitalea sp.]